MKSDCVRRWLIPALFVLAIVSPAQDFRGRLLGTVVDSSGGRVVGADIVLVAAVSSLEQQTKSDGRGEFRFDDLPPGAYHMTVRAAGMAEASSTVTVTVGSAREISVTLKPASAPPDGQRPGTGVIHRHAAHGYH